MSRKDDSVSEREDVSFSRFRPKHAARFFMAGGSGDLVGKRLEAIRSSSARSSCMVSALSSICVREGSLGFFSSGGSVWIGALRLARSLTRSVCTRTAADSVSHGTASAH